MFNYLRLIIHQLLSLSVAENSVLGDISKHNIYFSNRTAKNDILCLLKVVEHIIGNKSSNKNGDIMND